jgi:hypothetical protein
MAPKATTTTANTPTPPTPPTPRAVRTSAQVLKQQKADAERERAIRIAAANELAKRAAAKSQDDLDMVLAPVGTVVATATPTAVAMPDGRTPHEIYLDQIAPSGVVGRLIKFSKEGTFITNDDEAEIPDTADFVVLANETLVGWIRFNDDAPPDRVTGLLYDGFTPSPREALGDLDQSKWPIGLSGAPEDRWKHQMYLVLQGANGELFTFATSSKTGCRAVGNLLKHYDRMAKKYPDELPVVRLKVGGFPHKDERVGFVKTPVFVVVGRAPRDSAAKPDTSLAADLNDDIPFK